MWKQYLTVGCKTQMCRNINNDRWNRWIIVTKENYEIAGICLLFWNMEEKHWDISYNLGKKYWGYGYVTEAMKEVMKYGVEVLGKTLQAGFWQQYYFTFLSMKKKSHK